MLENDGGSIHDMTNTEQYDYEAIHAAVCPDPATLTKGQRDNRAWPTAKDMHVFLSLLGSEEWQAGKGSTPFNANKSAYHQAMNNGLLTGPRKGWDGNGAPTIKHRLTAKGAAYLCYLKVATHKPAPKTDTRAIVRRYERRFATSLREARCTAARIQAQRHAALNVLYRETLAALMDNRALMGGAV
jgi:hypothetical protein